VSEFEPSDYDDALLIRRARERRMRPYSDLVRGILEDADLTLDIRRGEVGGE